MRHVRKRRRGGIRRIAIACIGAAFVACAVWQRVALVSFMSDVRRASHVPDVVSALHSLHRETFGVLCMTSPGAADDCYVFDADGIIFGTAHTVVGDAIARIDDASAFKPAIGEPFLDAGVWQNLSPIVAAIKNGDMPVSVFVLKRAEREVVVTLSPSGTSLYFSLEFSPEKHLRALPEFMKKVRAETLEYADLRVEGKIFYYVRRNAAGVSPRMNGDVQ